jgi:hypothetical protein
VSATAGGRRTFALLPRRRLTGLPFGEIPSRRRGQGGDIIGHRPYTPGDPVTTIDSAMVRRSEVNEPRLARVLADCEEIRLQPSVLGTSEPDLADAAFIACAKQRSNSPWAP